MICTARWLCLLLAAGALAAGDARAQASAAPSERIHAPAQTHWARRGQDQMLTRLETMTPRITAPRPGARAGLQVRNGALKGTMHQVVVPISFADEEVSFDTAAIRRHLFGAAVPGHSSVRSYYAAASRGNVTVTGSVLAPVRLRHPAGYYTGERNPALNAGVADRLTELVNEALKAADARTDWRPFVDDEDPESRVAAVVLLHAGQSGRCDGDTAHAWPHRYHLRGLLGAPMVTRSRTADGRAIVLDDYVLQGVEECGAPGTLAPNGTLIHETGHLMGLPDLYDTTDRENGGPVGAWDLMATGDLSSPASPALLGAWSRALLGWAEVETIDPVVSVEREVLLERVSQTPRVIRIPFASTGEMVLLENRQRDGTDVGLPGGGMLVWYVNPERARLGLLTNRVNDRSLGYGVAVVQADGEDHLQGAGNRGDASDPWPGKLRRSAFTGTSTPAAASPRYGVPAGFALTGITEHPVGLGLNNVSFVFQPEKVESLVIAPETFPTLVRGRQANVEFRADAATPGDSLVWSADPEVLQRLGVSMDTISGRVSGRVRAAAGTYPMAVQVVSPALQRGGTRLFQVRVIDPAPVDADRAVSALLEPGRGLSAREEEFLDAVGNQNGRFDVGDLVLAIRSGVLSLTPAAAARLPL